MGGEPHTSRAVWLNFFWGTIGIRSVVAMATVLATALLRDVASEQQARNLLFPQATDSPVLWGCSAALCHQLQCLIDVPGNPLRDLQLLQAFTDQFGQKIASTMGPVSHGDFQWLALCPRPSDSERIAALHQLEVELRSLQPELLRWRQTLQPKAATLWLNLTEGLCVALFEISYFGAFDVLEVLASFIRQSQVRLQMAESVEAQAGGSSQWGNQGRLLPKRHLQLAHIAQRQSRGKSSETRRNCWAGRFTGRHLWILAAPWLLRRHCLSPSSLCSCHGLFAGRCLGHPLHVTRHCHRHCSHHTQTPPAHSDFRFRPQSWDFLGHRVQGSLEILAATGLPPLDTSFVLWHPNDTWSNRLLKPWPTTMSLPTPTRSQPSTQRTRDTPRYRHSMIA